MPGRDLLERFRPITAPGGVGPVGVPADIENGPEAELAVVFAALAPTLDTCDRIRADAREQAIALRLATEREAQQILARARLQATELRAESAARRRREGDRAGRQLLVDARAEAERIASRGAQRIPALVARVLDLVRADAGVGPP